MHKRDEEENLKRLYDIAKLALREYPHLSRFSDFACILRAYAVSMHAVETSMPKAVEMDAAIIECIRLLLSALEDQNKRLSYIGRVLMLLDMALFYEGRRLKQNVQEGKSEV
ncbi:MAG: hypothetical protein QXS54_11410 [Candidatus Methanomethylicaceae archaeon]